MPRGSKSRASATGRARSAKGQARAMQGGKAKGKVRKRTSTTAVGRTGRGRYPDSR